MCNIAIREYVKRTSNVHNIYTYNIGIPKHEKHLRLLSSGKKLFITFEFKGSSTFGDRYTFFLFWLFHLSPPSTCGARSAQTRLTSASPESRPFQNPKNPPRTLPVYDVIHIHWSTFLSGIFILTSVNDTSNLRARQHLRTCLYLTNLWTEQRFSA